MDVFWHEYLRRDSFKYRCYRLAPLLGFYILLCWLIYELPNFYLQSPIRGGASLVFHRLILSFSVPALVMLIFYVFDVTRVCRQLIVNISSKRPQWSPSSLSRFAADPDKTKERPLSEWMMVHLIAKRTEAVGRLIFYPIIVWFIMFAARFNYFDKWHTPPALAVVISLGAVYAWSCAFSLRKSAEDFRRGLIHNLKEELAGLLSTKHPDQDRGRQIEFVLSEIQSIREGTFAPFSQHPVVRSLLVPFGGIGGMYLIDLLSKMNV
jgi:hypothetical protein